MSLSLSQWICSSSLVPSISVMMTNIFLLNFQFRHKYYTQTIQSFWFIQKESLQKSTSKIDGKRSRILARFPFNSLCSVCCIGAVFLFADSSFFLYFLNFVAFFRIYNRTKVRFLIAYIYYAIVVQSIVNRSNMMPRSLR